MNTVNNFGFYICIATILVLSACKQDSTFDPVKEDSLKEVYYQEKHRPQIHFSPEANWMNDPNGMVFYEGEYHLFYQYYPDSTVWGPMHWGHAVSEDMVHWDHLPVALYPDSLGYIFSGSAVIDWDNSSGLGVGDQPPMIAIFTHHNNDGERAQTNTFQYQSIAYSHDKGRTWTKYAGNPVVKNPGIKDFRDPKVVWDKQRNQWVMVFAAYDKAMFYTSDNLIDWNWSGEFGIAGDTRLWECPDLFPMMVVGSDQEKWVLITSIQKEAPNGGTATSYFVGDFDGKAFIADPNDQKWLDYGTDNYAFVTWADVPDTDGRRLGLGWMSNWQYAQDVPTAPWRSAMTLPRELELYKEADGEYYLRSLPVSELSSIENSTTEIIAQNISDGLILWEGDQPVLAKVDLSFKPIGGIISIKLSNNQEESLFVGYNVSDQTYYIDRTFAGPSGFSEVFADYHLGQAKYAKESVDMTLYLDHSSIELFADGGRCVMTDIFFPSTPFTKMEIVTESNDVWLSAGSVTPLRSIW